MQSDSDFKSTIQLDVTRCKACEIAFLPRRKSRTTAIFTLLTVVHIVAVRVSGATHKGLDMCEPIDIPLCAGMPYNMTRMPNHLHHSTQENARLAIEPYGELVKQNCSVDLLFFLCAMFAPICTPHFQTEAIPPCRSVCQRSKHGCEPLMNSHNFSWPEDLDCSLLPEYDKGVCVSPEAIVSSVPAENVQSATDSTITGHYGPNKECKCERTKPTRKVYKKGKFDYAIGCKISRITHLDKNTTVVSVTVDKILKRGKVHLQERRDVDLWGNSDCLCPSLKPHKEYLIIGREDVLLNRLKLSHDSLVTRWKRKWETKFKKWEAKRKRKKGRKNKKGRCRKNKKKCGKNNSESDHLCRAEQVDESKKRIKCTKKDSNEENVSSRRRESRKNRKNKKENPNSISGR